MTFLIDNNLSPRLAEGLAQLGHEAIHVRELGLAAADDPTVLAEAESRNCVLLTADSDFPEMLALSGASGPSVLYLTGLYPSDPEPLAVLIHNQLSTVEESLEAGAVVALDGSWMRIRQLPIGG